MKKLMLTAAAAAMATGAFAIDPLVYSYRASITHMYVRLVSVNQQVNHVYNGGQVPAGRVQVYQKFKKTSTLNGFLVQDTQGVTSRNLNAGRQNSPIYDQGRNRAFLVVRNASVDNNNVRRPKILPAVLEAKWYDTRFAHDRNGQTSESAGTAQGILYVGGELLFGNLGAGVRAKLDNGRDLPFNEDANAYINAGNKSRTPVMFADHLWTGAYLFGQYNGPQWSGNYQNIETAINNVHPNYFALPANVGPVGTQVPAFARMAPVYHDSWMNHAGIGTYTLTNPGVDDICCGLSLGAPLAGKRLDTLDGNMKGGLYICSDNGYIQATNPALYEPFLGVLWEDQFWSFEASPRNLNYVQTIGTQYDITTRATWAANTDPHQSDVWTDGNIDQNTTDVMYGTWSIRRVTNYQKRAITWQERNLLAAATWPSKTAAPEAEWRTVPGNEGTEAAPLAANEDENDLLETIKGAAVNLDSSLGSGAVTGDTARFMVREAAFQSREIYDYNSRERFAIPFLTTRFARAYGLAVYR